MAQSHSTTYPHVIEMKNLTRDIDGHWETIEPQIQQFWHKVPKELRRREYEHDGCSVSVDINWQPLATRLRRDNELVRPLRENRPPVKDWQKKLLQPTRIRAEVTVSGANKVCSHDWYPTFFLDTFVHEIFLIANLSVPGSADFYSASIARPNQRHSTEVRLSAFAFDCGWTDSLDGEWPSLQALPREDVCRWFEALNIGYKQRAETGIERALYVLLHLARDDTRIDSVTWLFHGLEALVSTKVGESVSGLVRRLAAVLDLDELSQKRLNKRLRQLYDWRSSFVHGGYAVPHPASSEVIDRRLDAHLMELHNLRQFGASLLIATLQALIKKRIVELRFDEQLVTTTIGARMDDRSKT
ncbi:hypothetical protein C8K18_10367 [Paraburkholderia sp. GV068]|uniref:hypothetical protein n=2 Tax=Paraburkholderia TaxID=1822464 RepID=UPI000D2F97E5|nr:MULTISPECIES: hypothetical protein [unclassified Paraburkholderia]MDR6477145.1 hypothetical protein [Paraburkholderia graminis]PTR02325.1 hypothetical protein C8K19_10367 [Paraburkholderia sp. GV072]PUB06802.1 hypothetical protein C8K18_10367 [Paraburkholderia sp. GV068]